MGLLSVNFSYDIYFYFLLREKKKEQGPVYSNSIDFLSWWKIVKSCKHVQTYGKTIHHVWMFTWQIKTIYIQLGGSL